VPPEPTPRPGGSEQVQPADDGAAHPGVQPASAKPAPAIPHDEADGRAKYDWRSRYPHEARVEIRLETLYVVTVLALSLLGVLWVWTGAAASLLCPTCNETALRKYAYFFSSGVLGGSLFGGKYLYYVVARGFWHQDRRLWRLLSPWLAGSLAFAVGTLMDAGFLGVTIKSNSPATYIALGFITGYFGDKALAKMREVADVIFSVRDTGPTKPNEPAQERKREGL
jgi:hypothetical protein